MKSENSDEKHLVQFENWLSIILLWIGLSFSVFKGFSGELKAIMAIVLLLISTIFTFKNYKLGVKITFVTIILGILNLLDFFPIKLFVSFGFDKIGIGIEFILLLIGIIHYATNKKELSELFKNLMNREISEEEVLSENRKDIDSFKRRFEKKKFLN